MLGDNIFYGYGFFERLKNAEEKPMKPKSNYIEAVQTRQGLYVACIEEIALAGAN